MNSAALQFFRQNYEPGRVCLIGCSDPLFMAVRVGQSGLTPDGKPSKFNHAVLMGPCRDDGRNDGSIYIYESDLHVSVKDWCVMNGVMESRIVKWCRDDIEHAAVLGVVLDQNDQKALLRKALEIAHDENHMRYPVGELFGTFWAIITGRLNRRNIFDLEHAEQCATFVRRCYKESLGIDLVSNSVHLTHTAPEHFYQSSVFTFRKEWTRPTP
jgi:hypothetical protein